MNTPITEANPLPFTLIQSADLFPHRSEKGLNPSAPVATPPAAASDLRCTFISLLMALYPFQFEFRADATLTGRIQVARNRCLGEDAGAQSIFAEQPQDLPS